MPEALQPDLIKIINGYQGNAKWFFRIRSSKVDYGELIGKSLSQAF